MKAAYVGTLPTVQPLPYNNFKPFFLYGSPVYLEQTLLSFSQTMQAQQIILTADLETEVLAQSTILTAACHMLQPGINSNSRMNIRVLYTILKILSLDFTFLDLEKHDMNYITFQVH